MRVINFPKRHLGARQPGAFVLQVPVVEASLSTVVFSDVDTATQAAVREELQRLSDALDVTLACSGRLTALMRPFLAENLQ